MRVGCKAAICVTVRLKDSGVCCGKPMAKSALIASKRSARASATRSLTDS